MAGALLGLNTERKGWTIMPFRFGPWEIGLILLIFSPVYFVPTIVAIVRHTKHQLGIISLNILAGWTFIGWVIALIWASTADKKTAPPPSPKS